MAGIVESTLRDRLHDRRRRLQEAVESGVETPRLSHLLQDIDAALARFDAGTYGVCESCHESIEVERLLGDPLVRTCLDHLTPGERQALEEDLDLAARVQGRLLPEGPPAVPGWEACYRYEPAGALGGDYCDLVASGDGARSLYFLLGDVAGKGMAASILMASLRAIVRTLVESGPSVHSLAMRSNRLFCETALPQHYATLVCGKASPAGEIEICNAGHCPPMVVRRGGISTIGASGLPIGLFCSSEYEVHRLRLEPAETLFLFTDGLSEARGRSDAEYGTERLAGVLARQGHLPLNDLVSACLQDVAAFRAGAPRTDDLTLLAIRRSAGA